MAAKKPKLALNLDQITSGVSLTSTINSLDSSKNVSSDSTRAEKEIRSYKRIHIDKLKSSSLNDYPIEDIEQLEYLLLLHGLLEPISVSYIEEEDRYEIESGDRRYHALSNLFNRFENSEGDIDPAQMALYKKNLHSLYVDGIYCMQENGPQDTDNKRARIIIHNETARQFDPIRTSSKLAELADIYTRQNKALPATERFNVNERIAQELKGRYTVRHIIRLKNFDSLIDELKNVVVKHNMNIAEISSYHKLSPEEQLVLVEYIENCYSTGRQAELPTVEDIRNIITTTSAELSSAQGEQESSEILSDSIFNPDDTEPAINNPEISSNSLDELKTRAVKKIIEQKDKKEVKIKSAVDTLHKKSEQLEKILLSAITESSDSQNLEINIEEVVSDIEKIVEKLNSIKETLSH